LEGKGGLGTAKLTNAGTKVVKKKFRNKFGEEVTRRGKE